MIILIALFLILVAYSALLSSFGILLARDAFDRLHYLGPVTVLGSLALLVAVVFSEGFSVLTGKVALTVLILVATGPVITHAIARAGVVRGDARNLRDEHWEDST